MSTRGLAGRHRRRFKMTTIADPTTETKATDLAPRCWRQAIGCDYIWGTVYQPRRADGMLERIGHRDDL